MACSLIPFVVALLAGAQDTSSETRGNSKVERPERIVAEATERAGERVPVLRAKPRVRDADRRTTVLRLDHLPAADVAKTVGAWLEAEEDATGQAPITVIPEALTNSLVVSGSLEQLETIGDFVEALDQRPPQIRVKAMLVDLTLPGEPQSAAGQAAATVSHEDIGSIIAELRKRGELRVFARPELVAINNQPAYLQFGGRVPRVVAASQTPAGRTNQVELENVGTILGVTGRVSKDDWVTLEIDLERSHLGPEDEGTPLATSGDMPIVRAVDVNTVTLQTTVSLHDGQTALIGGMVYQNKERWGELLLLLQSEVVR